MEWPGHGVQWASTSGDRERKGMEYVLARADPLEKRSGEGIDEEDDDC